MNAVYSIEPRNIGFALVETSTRVVVRPFFRSVAEAREYAQRFNLQIRL